MDDVGAGLEVPGERPAALVALGSNLGDPLEQLRRAAAALERLATVCRWSPVYRTAPVGGPPGQPAYLNAVAMLAPFPAWSSPEALLEGLLAIERQQGRVRRERWGPRTLDLDLLALGDAVVASSRLTLPHPRMMERSFVLAPLCDRTPDWRHPVTGEGACEALARLGLSGVRRTRLSWRPR
ncbi:MAG: 2-amino-4-hydroxy-6-hydroxymethyldihydropteridine diphosphokinase [Deinococcales bacterium]